MLASGSAWCCRSRRRGPGACRSATGPRRAGPTATARRLETGLLDKWALNGDGMLWRAPYGGRSAPVVMGNRVYVQNPAGRGADLRERVMALDADTGKLVWEYRFNLFQSDVPPHRIGWASPAIDPETGNIYALSGGAEAIALSRDGKPLWQRSFGEEFAAFTTHGGRTMNPLVDGDLVIVSAAVSNWGTQRQPRPPPHRPRQAHRRRHLRRQPGRPALRHRVCRADRSPPSTACACSSPGWATAPSTPSSRRPARRCGASSPPSAPSTPAWS